MLPMRWSQPPWRNIEVRGVKTCRSPITQLRSRLIGRVVPSGIRRRNSPGMRPRSHTDCESVGSTPMPWTRIQAATLRPIRTTVIAGC